MIVIPKRQKLILFAVLAGATLIAFVLALPRLLNIDRYRPKVIAYLEEKLGKQVEIDRLTLDLFPLSLGIENLNVKNPDDFPSGYIVKIGRIRADLDPRALWHREVIIRALVLNHPVINLLSDPGGAWNFENPKAKGSQRTFPLGLIYNVQIEGGDLIASTLLPSGARGPVFFEAHEIYSDLEDVNLIGIISLSSSSASDGRGTVRASHLSFGAVDTENLAAGLQLEPRKAFFTEIKADVFGGSAMGDLSFDLSGTKTAFRTQVHFTGLRMEHLLSAFENGRGKMTGRMEGDVTLSGLVEPTMRPLAGLRGKGHLTIRDGEAPTLQLNANLKKLVRFNNLGPAKENPSAFNKISTDLELDNLHVTGKNIDIDGYGVDIDGSGSISVDGFDEVNCQGTAQITAPQGFLTNTFARFAGGKLQNGRILFPFRIDGTVEKPTFSKSTLVHKK
jgi:uncharacterized protein involved in outer membrane biogenesis